MCIRDRKDADARIVYEARTEAIWSARRGSEPDGGTTPENSEGWVTVTFEGNSQTMIFYDGGTNDAVTGPGGGVKAPKKWPDNFVNDTSSTYNNWHGASRETGDVYKRQVLRGMPTRRKMQASFWKNR